LTVHDNGNTGTGGDLVSTATKTINITAVNDAPVFSPTSSTLTIVTNAGASGGVTFTEAALAAYFTDPEGSAVGINTVANSSGLTSATGTGLGSANVGTIGTITITDNTTLSGVLAVTATDGSAASTTANVTFTNSATSTTSLTAAGSGDSIIVNDQTTGATLTGGAGNDYIIGNTGADTIVGAQNDIVLDGGGGTDTLNIGANFTSTSDAQIVNIENVTLTAASTLNLSNQTEGFTITGSSGIDSITAGSGNDTIVGAQNDALLDGGGGTDTLNIGASFASTSDAQIVNIENITLTASGTTLNLSNQTEGFTITGSSGADTITGGSGNDTITGGGGADTMTGGSGSNTFVVNATDSNVTIGGTGNSGTITGYDVITDFKTGSDTLDLSGTAAAAANTTGTNGSDSTLTISSATVKSHAISNGIVTFDDANTYAAALNLTSTANVAAVVQYLSKNDIGSIGTTVAFTATIGGVAHTYIYEQLTTNSPGGTSTNYLVVDLANVTLTSGGTSLTSLISAGRVAPAGVSGEPINLALAEPANHVGDISVTIAGVPAGWSLSEGVDHGNGTWTVTTTHVNDLTITSPSDYTGAMAFDVTMNWTNADGSAGHAAHTNNVEAYAPGNPIFAIAGDDNLTASSGSDLLVFAQPMGHSVVFNFDAAHDSVDLMGFTNFSTFADVYGHLINDAGSAVLTLGDGMSVTFSGVDASALTPTNFMFDFVPLTTNAGSMVLSDGTIMPFAGIVENSGLISLGSSGDGTELQIIQHGLTLKGGGSIILSDDDGNLISGTGADVVLTNIDNTISGAGHIGQGQLTLINQGTIVASGNHALNIDTGNSGVVNSGTLESTGSGGLTIHGALDNSGLLWANGGNISISGDISGNGAARLSGTAHLELGGLFDDTIAIDTNATATLTIDHAAQFRGIISGFNGDDHLHVADLAAESATFNYMTNAEGTGGVLSVTDGTHVASINFTGHYQATDFHVAADPNGGTTITYIPHQDLLI
jgi:Ca2+-binding RTX toxin-like protein